jgi:UDP-glucose 4-epimerase
VASAEKAVQVLGWTPVQSGVDRVIETAYGWHLKEIERKTAR